MLKPLFFLAAAAASLSLASSAPAATTTSYHLTSVEPIGGPIQAPFSCALGTSCGTVTISGFGHATNDVIVFNACGPGCGVRTITFDDGSTLVIDEQILSLESRGAGAGAGYGSPILIRITQSIVGGSGRFAGASGEGTGTVTGAGGAAIVEASGTITLP